MEGGISVLSLFDLSCPICLEECNTKTISELDVCSHLLCEECFKDLIKYSNKCPLCSQIFSSCKYKEGQNTISEYSITELELININNHKNSLYKGSKIHKNLDETFECFTREEIKRELNFYKKLAENIKNDLFVKRNCNGSQKEFAVYEEIMDRVFSTNSMMDFEIFDTKCIVKNLDFIAQEIKSLQKRIYQHEILYEQEEVIYYGANDNLGANFNCAFTIEYVDRKKSGPKKKKKK